MGDDGWMDRWMMGGGWMGGFRMGGWIIKPADDMRHIATAQSGPV